MDATQAKLINQVLRKRLPDLRLEPGEYKLAGTALVDLQVGIVKSENTGARPSIPWKEIVALLVPRLGRRAATEIAEAAAFALGTDAEIPLPHEIEAALDQVLKPLPLTYREGPTRIAGDVALAGFAPAAVELPGWRELREAIART